jgi:hypothetical protein
MLAGTINYCNSPSDCSIFVLCCRCGGIGRRARLKIVYRKMYRFESDHRYWHHKGRFGCSKMAFFVYISEHSVRETVSLNSKYHVLLSLEFTSISRKVG